MIPVSRLTYKRLNQKIVEALRVLAEFQQEDSKKHQSVSAGVSPDLDREQILQEVIVNLKHTLSQCKIRPLPKDNSTVQIGHYVIIENNGQEHTFMVDGVAVNHQGTKIVSATSPIGKIILGQKVGYETKYLGKKIIIKAISVKN